MKKLATTGLIVALLAGTAVCRAQEAPKPAKEKEHDLLQQLVGEWEADVEAFHEPGKPPYKTKGSETTRSVGGLWVISENRGDMMGTPFTGVLTLGYDPQKKKLVGTWIDSFNTYLWHYEGTVDDSGKVLTLLAEGPCCQTPGKLRSFKEVYEVKDRDHKVFTSYVQGDDGQWVRMLNVNYRRKK